MTVNEKQILEENELLKGDIKDLWKAYELQQKYRKPN